MRDFFKKEVLARTYEIFGVNQLEKMEDDQITFLLDALENVSQLYDYIPQAEQKKIINKRLLTDRDFRNINARLIAGWFEMDGKIFFTQKHHKENQTDPNYKPLEGEERDKAIQAYLDALAKVKLNFIGGEEKKSSGSKMRDELYGEMSEGELIELERLREQAAETRRRKKEYIASNYDKETGNALETWLPEDEWLRKHFPEPLEGSNTDSLKQ